MQKSDKNIKKKAHLFGFFPFSDFFHLFGFFPFSLLYPVCIFCILNLKIHIKNTKMQKKAKFFFQIAKINMQKKHKIIFQKKMQKKACGV